MPVPPIDEVQRLLAKLPYFDLEALQVALQHSGKELQHSRRELFEIRMNEALRNYFVERLWELWHAKMPPAKVAAELARLTAAIEKVIRLLDLTEIRDGPRQRGRLSEQFRLTLSAQATLYAEKGGGFPDLPPREFTATVGKSSRITRKDYREDEKLKQFLDSLELWHRIAGDAYDYTRKKVTPAENRKRRSRNEPLHILFCSINDVWDEAFDDLPADGWNEIEGEADGPYFRFLHKLFELVRARIDPTITAAYPQLSQDLKLSLNGIRGRYRQTAEAKLRSRFK